MGRDTISRRRPAAAREYRHVRPQPASCPKRTLPSGRPRSVSHALSRDVFALVDPPFEGQHRSDQLVRQASGYCLSGHTLRGGGDRARAARRVLMLPHNLIRTVVAFAFRGDGGDFYVKCHLYELRGLVFDSASLLS